MPFIRLSDNYIDHPKFLALSASAFRLWHEGMAFCRKHQTDGLIPMSALQGFRYFKPPRVAELTTSYLAGHAPLWEPIEGIGFKVHDYLDWNLSKEEEQTERLGAAARMRKWRGGTFLAPVTAFETRNSDRNERVTEGVTNAFVPDRIGEEKDQKKSPERRSGGKPRDASSKRPIFSGQSFVVFEWMLDDFMRTLGGHTDAFQLDVWFDTLDARTLAAGLIVPKESLWGWLQQEFLAEIRVRGLPVVAVAEPDASDAMWDAIGKKGPSR